MNIEAYDQILTYITRHPIATLGTINPDGSPHGAIVYIFADHVHPAVYFITKQQTKKYQNLQERNQVSLTIVDPAESSTLQASGRASSIQDAAIIDAVMQKMTNDHVSAKEWLPPIAKLRAGAYEVVCVTLTHARLARFQGMAIGDEHIFTETEV